jgi:hypothetical protein
MPVKYRKYPDVCVCYSECTYSACESFLGSDSVRFLLRRHNHYARTSHRVLVLIDQVLGEVLHHKLVRLVGHPSVHKGCEVQVRRAVKGELIVDNLVCGLRVCSL